jgi:hypothetical protein
VSSSEGTFRVFTNSASSRTVAKASVSELPATGKRVKVWRGADGERRADGVEGGAAGHGVKNKGGSDAIGEVEIANGRQGITLTGQALEHHLLLVVRDSDAGDGGSSIDHLRRDLGGF